MSIEELIDGLVVQTETIPAASLLHRCLTLDGRIPTEDALAPLSMAEHYAYRQIASYNASLSSNSGNMSLGFRPHGRCYLLLRPDFDAYADELTLIGHATLPADDIRGYQALVESEKRFFEKERPNICTYLSKRGFRKVCKELSDLSEHMAPLIHYVGSCCISNFYYVGKSRFDLESTLLYAIQHVAERCEEAEIEPLTAIYCLDLLRLSGGYTRLEELNSTQLSVPALIDFFTAKQTAYCNLVGDIPGIASLEEQAVLLARMRETISRKYRFIRVINGLNLRKKEDVLRVSPAYGNVLSASTSYIENILTAIQQCLDTGASARRLLSPESFGSLLNKTSLSGEHGNSFGSYLEYLIDKIVTQAIRDTCSDFGMTRGARNFAQFATALRDNHTEIVCDRGQAEYFCHVVPSQAMQRAYPTKKLATTLNAISGRMRFNSWHYAPSYFDSTIPPGRKWFYAPRMADIAEWSDQHHTGHVNAMVRYSIRSPLPLCLSDKTLPGFIDLRLMRQKGNPYSHADLTTAIKYTEALQFVYQCLLDHVQKENNDFVFSFGDKQWFDEIYSTA